MLYNETLNVIPLDIIPLNVYKKVCNPCMVHIILFVVFFITSICISSVFIYLSTLKKGNISTNFSSGF